MAEDPPNPEFVPIGTTTHPIQKLTPTPVPPGYTVVLVTRSSVVLVQVVAVSTDAGVCAWFVYAGVVTNVMYTLICI